MQPNLTLIILSQKRRKITFVFSSYCTAIVWIVGGVGIIHTTHILISYGSMTFLQHIWWFSTELLNLLQKITRDSYFSGSGLIHPETSAAIQNRTKANPENIFAFSDNWKLIRVNCDRSQLPELACCEWCAWPIFSKSTGMVPPWIFSRKAWKSLVLIILNSDVMRLVFFLLNNYNYPISWFGRR